MGEFENRPGQSEVNEEVNDSRSVEEIIQSVKQDLRSLQQDLSTHLSQDIGKLQAEKSRLQNEIEKLQAQQQVLQSQQQVLLSQQQLAQQRLWAKQLAQALAGHLYTLLAQRMSQADLLAAEQDPSLPAGNGGKLSPQTTQQLLALDAALNQSLGSLQRDLTSYQSVLSQQLSRMQNLEQQGEALLEALVSRLSQKLQTEAARAPLPQRSPTPSYRLSAPPESSNGTGGLPNLPSVPPPSSPSSLQETPPAPPQWVVPPVPNPPAQNTLPPTRSLLKSIDLSSPVATWVALGLLVLGILLVVLLLGTAVPAPTLGIPLLVLLVGGVSAFLLYQRVFNSRAAASTPVGPAGTGSPGVRSLVGRLSPAQVGLVFILMSTLALSLHNVVVGIVGGSVSLFGIFNLPASISLDSFSDSLFILWLRMLVVVPVMTIISRVLYPNVWKDVRRFLLSKDRRLMVNVIGSGSFLFGSQVFIYMAIAATSPGVAVTILFMYPLVTVPLAWFLFGDRPSRLRVGVMLTILIGVVLTAFPRLAATTNISAPGVVAAVVSGILFALYLISMQISFRKLHPVPVSFIQFITIFVLTNIMLIPFGIQEAPNNLSGVLLGGLVLGTLTLIGYLLNNLGVKMMGAAQASIIASSGPVLTAILAFTITPSPRTALRPVQILGILLVTVAVLALSFEKMIAQRKAAKASR